MWIQDVVIVLAVGGSVAFLFRRSCATLLGKGSKIGSCCSKGCGAQETPKSDPAARQAFIPLEALSRRK